MYIVHVMSVTDMLQWKKHEMCELSPRACKHHLEALFKFLILMHGDV